MEDVCHAILHLSVAKPGPAHPRGRLPSEDKLGAQLNGALCAEGARPATGVVTVSLERDAEIDVSRIVIEIRSNRGVRHIEYFKAQLQTGRLADPGGLGHREVQIWARGVA